MENKTFKKYYLISLISVIAASFYPLYMGARVIFDMIKDGSVAAENYPKYIIPYTPISIAVIVGVALIPFFMKRAKKYHFLFAFSLSTVVFLACELMLEDMVIVKGIDRAPIPFSELEAWQMYMCAMPTKERPWSKTAVEILIGDYSPTFKIHFYMISFVIIISLLNSFYGFAEMIRSGDKSRLKALILQSSTGVAFLLMCIWACFTAFYRDGSMLVSPLSATLMCVFFILLGVSVGIFTGSFLLGRRKAVSVFIPSAVASLITLVMYIAEMCLLSGHLYRFGKGFLFDGIGTLVLAPIDIIVIIFSGALCAIVMKLISIEKKSVEKESQ